MFGLLTSIREFFGRCPICGGELKMTSHDCIQYLQDQATDENLNKISSEYITGELIKF